MPANLRVGFIGVGDRGTTLLRQALTDPSVLVPAVCDIDHAHLARAQDLVEKSRGKAPRGIRQERDRLYRRLLARGDLDAVLIATLQELHAVMTIDAFHAGVFVASEVPACCTVEECGQLLDAQKQTGGHYMMLENYLYSRPVMQVDLMARRGAFGELTYAAGSYIHEIRAMRFNPDGSLTWRGHNVLNDNGIIYPTHAVGPVARWLGINKDDRFTSLTAMSSKPAGNRAFAIDKFGPDSPQAKVDFKNGDCNLALLRTQRGRLVEIRYDTASPRPSGMGQYSLQGAKGAYDSAFGQRKLYLEHRSPADTWEPLEQYQDEFVPELWKRSTAKTRSRRVTSNGSDFFCHRGISERRANKAIAGGFAGCRNVVSNQTAVRAVVGRRKRLNPIPRFPRINLSHFSIGTTIPRRMTRCARRNTASVGTQHTSTAANIAPSEARTLNWLSHTVSSHMSRRGATISAYMNIVYAPVNASSATTARIGFAFRDIVIWNKYAPLARPVHLGRFIQLPRQGIEEAFQQEDEIPVGDEGQRQRRERVHQVHLAQQDERRNQRHHWRKRRGRQ